VLQCVEKVVVGAIIDRPQILLKQNLSPQGENRVIFLRKIRKTFFFGGQSMIAPTVPDRKRSFLTV
jgi:hypothetical protein